MSGIDLSSSQHLPGSIADDVAEIQLLLSNTQLASLDGAARAKGCTIGHLIRNLLNRFIENLSDREPA
jgi:hypothetical protein